MTRQGPAPELLFFLSRPGFRGVFSDDGRVEQSLYRLTANSALPALSGGVYGKGAPQMAGSKTGEGNA